MANEEKILEMLESIQADMQAMKADIASLKKNETDGKTDPPKKQPMIGKFGNRCGIFSRRKKEIPSPK